MSTNWKYWDDTGEHEWDADDPLPNAADLFKLEFVNQFIDAFNERIKVCTANAHGTWTFNSGGFWNSGQYSRFRRTLITQAVSGDDVTSCATAAVTSIRWIQYRIISDTYYLADPYTIHGLYLGFCSQGTLSGSDIVPPYFDSAEDLYAAAGLNEDGPRRHIVDGDELYGAMQAGDIIGPWIFEDIRKMLAALKYTCRSGGTDQLYDSVGYANDNTALEATYMTGSSVQIPGNPDPAVACQDAWDAATYAAGDPALTSWGGNYFAKGIHSEEWVDGSGNTIEVYIIQNSFSTDVQWINLNRHKLGRKALNVYVYPKRWEVSYGLWNDYGTGWTEGSWNLIASSGVSTADTEDAPAPGNVEPKSLMPTFCPYHVGSYSQIIVGCLVNCNATLKAMIEWQFQYE